MIKSLIFDVDGVLVNEEKKYFSYFLEKEHAIPRSVTSQFFDGEFVECVMGKRDLKDVLPNYLSKWGWKGTFEDALNYWHTKEHILNDLLLEEMTKYKEKGLNIYVATNQEKYRTQYIINQMGFGKIFNQVVSSSMLGKRKPALEFFEILLKKLGIQEPSTVLFWDDTQENVDVAREVGIHGELYRSFGQYKKTMSETYHL